MARASFFWAWRIDWYSLAWTSVPMPSLEKTSASSPSETRPSMTWTRSTPPRAAFTAWSSLDTDSGLRSARDFRRMVSASEDAGRVGDQGVADGPAQVGGGQPFEDGVADAGGGGDGQLQRRGVGDADAVGVGRGDAALDPQLPYLQAGPVDQRHADP